MDLGDILSHDAIILSLPGTSKKQVLQELADRAAAVTGGDAHEIFSRLLQRERLSSTGLGKGIAIPHARIASTKKIVALFARLEAPVAFESADGEPVDLLFLLLSPEHAGGDHLKTLARISRLVRDAAALDALRSAPDLAALRRVLTSPEASHAA